MFGGRYWLSLLKNSIYWKFFLQDVCCNFLLFYTSLEVIRNFFLNLFAPLHRQENCEVWKMVSQFFKESIVSCGPAWIIAVFNFLSHLLFMGPGSILAHPLGARSCIFSHQLGVSSPYFKESTSKAYSFVQVWLGYHLIYWELCCGLGCLLWEFNLQNYTFSIKSYFTHYLSLGLWPYLSRLKLIPHNY